MKKKTFTQILWLFLFLFSGMDLPAQFDYTSQCGEIRSVNNPFQEVIFTTRSWKVTYHGCRYDPGANLTCFFYTVWNNNQSPNISHFVFGEELCANNCLASSTEASGTWTLLESEMGQFLTKNPGGGRPVFGNDPTTGICGVKFDEQTQNDNRKQYYICVEGNATPSTINIAVKAGNIEEVREITGPGAATCATLPVEMTYFQAEKTDRNEVRLRWQTALEIDNEGFEVQHSFDGRDWEALDFVEGYGTVAGPRDYSYLHARPRPGVNYYRLKQMDFDGAFTYSDVLPVKIEAGLNDRLTVFPNPVQSGSFTLYLPETQTSAQDISLQIFDNVGRLVHQRNLTNAQTANIHTPDLPRGVYVLRLEMDRQLYWTRVAFW